MNKVMQNQNRADWGSLFTSASVIGRGINNQKGVKHYGTA